MIIERYLQLYFQNMILDIITAIVLGLGFYQGFSKGLVKTIFSTMSIIIGVFAALKLSPLVISILGKAFNLNPAINFLLGFILTFVIVMYLIRLIGKSIDKLFEELNISGLNKLAGGALLGFLYLLILSYGFYLVEKFNLDYFNTAISESITYPLTKGFPELSQSLFQSLKPIFMDFWELLSDSMDSMKDAGENLNTVKEE